MFSCECLNVIRPTLRAHKFRDHSPHCDDSSVKLVHSADADSKQYGMCRDLLGVKTPTMPAIDLLMQ